MKIKFNLTVTHTEANCLVDERNFEEFEQALKYVKKEYSEEYDWVIKNLDTQTSNMFYGVFDYEEL